ncbi:MAG: hypothetical protein M1835_004745 [Candelina submexicana]|nr:MAG: hypothetical protein M1835_004745 [Candelina submexicana]
MFFIAVALSLVIADRSHAQRTLTETVYGSVIFTRYGERTPLISSLDNVLTPFGAQQLHSAGQQFRSRYITPLSGSTDGSVVTNSSIMGISPRTINNSQIYAASLVDEYVVNSAQAFLQGLYPPANVTDVNAAQSILANGSVTVNPLGGYQYAQLATASPNDPAVIWLAGNVNCPQYDVSGTNYFGSQAFTSIQQSTRAFYTGLEASMLEGILPDSSVGFYNAYGIFDYANYGYNHNSSIHGSLSTADLQKLRLLADQKQFALNGDLTASGKTQGDQIRAISGRTLAGRILGLMLGNIETEGSNNKISAMFGSYEPFLAFFSLAQLSSFDPNFSGIPDYGSSMVFELFSVGDNGTSKTYPDESELKVRFLFRNGTGDGSQLVAYPLFGRGRSQTVMSLNDFFAGMKKIMIPSVGSWCYTCSSQSLFCSAYANRTGYLSGYGDDNESNSSGGGMAPPVAGVIGAVVTLAVTAIAVAAAMLLGGVRFHRSSAKRRSELGGFKAGEKLASDPDLTSGAKGGAGASVTDKGHERIGSWELADKKKTDEGELGNPSRSMPKDDDELSINPFDDPVKADERV